MWLVIYVCLIGLHWISNLEESLARITFFPLAPVEVLVAENTRSSHFFMEVGNCYGYPNTYEYGVLEYSY